MSKLLHMALLCLAIVGCGFRPVYAPQAFSGGGDDVDVAAVFRQFKIDIIKDREGQILRDHLIQILQPDGADPQSSYVLNISLTESKSNLAVKKTAFATRASLTIRANVGVTRSNDRAGLVNTTAEITSGYNIFSSEYQTLAAERGARERVLEELAHEIHTRLGALMPLALRTKPVPPS